MLDEIANSDIPVEKVSWWVDINEKQCINGCQYADISQLIEALSCSLGIQTHEDKMNRIIDRYNELYHAGRLSEAEECLSEYLRGVSLKGKVHLLRNIICGNLQNTTLLSPAKTIDGKLPKALLTHTKHPRDSFLECKQITVNGDIFTIANDLVFHRWNRGDAHVIWIWKNDELIHTIGALVEATGLQVFLDSRDGILYIVYCSDEENFEAGEYIESRVRKSIVTVEIANDVICSDFRFIE